MRRIPGRILVVGFLLLVAVYLGGATGTVLLASLIICMVLEVLYAFTIPKDLTAMMKVPAYVRKGKEITVEVLIYERMPIPVLAGVLWISIGNRFFTESEKNRHAYSLHGRHLHAKVRLVPEMLGILAFRVEKVEISGVLGIWKRRIPLKLEKETMVIPAFEKTSPLEEARYHAIMTGEEDYISLRGRDYHTFSGVRPYRQGDSLKQIHWKLTGKFDDYLVKEPEEPGRRQPVLFLETRMDKTDAAGIDALIEQYLAVSAQLAEDGYAHTLCFRLRDNGSFRYYRINRAEQLDEVYDILFRVLFYKEGVPSISAWDNRGSFSELIYVTDYWMGEQVLPDWLPVTILRHRVHLKGEES